MMLGGCGCRTNARVGKIRDGPQSVRHARPPRDIPPRDAQHLAPPPLAQQLLRFGGGGRRRGASLVALGGQARSRWLVVAQRPRQGLRVLYQGRRDERAGRRHAGQFGARFLRHGLVSGQQRRRRDGPLPPQCQRLA
jgi:hypothetical protein